MLNANVESNTTLFVAKAEPAWLGPAEVSCSTCSVPLCVSFLADPLRLVGTFVSCAFVRVPANSIAVRAHKIAV